MAERFDIGRFAYAHRGLWSGDGPAENSLAAFVAAANRGFGIELDVRPSRDGVPMVFHDPLLDRMASASGLFCMYDAETLRGVSLKGGGTIPALETVFELGLNVPILVEMKIDGLTEPRAFAAKVADCLDAYDGPAAAMSFHHEAVEALPSSVMRGLLVAPHAMIGETGFAETLEIAERVRPDYLACHTSDIARARMPANALGQPLLAWTVDTPDMASQLSSIADGLIFESLDPDMVRVA